MSTNVSCRSCPLLWHLSHCRCTSICLIATRQPSKPSPPQVDRWNFWKVVREYAWSYMFKFAHCFWRMHCWSRWKTLALELVATIALPGEITLRGKAWSYAYQGSRGYLKILKVHQINVGKSAWFCATVIGGAFRGLITVEIEVMLKGHCIEFGVVWIDSAIVVWKWCE